MADASITVELGLDLGNNSPIGFKLDDATRGVLDNTTYVLGGELFYDISPRVQVLSIGRGKNEALDQIDAGSASITLDNSDRLFDPLYEAGTYYGALIPRREVRIKANGYPAYFGYVDDFDIQYEPGDRSTTSIQCVDGFSVLANALLDEYTPSEQLSGVRITEILDLPEVAWPTTARAIDTGDSLMDATLIVQDTNALEYLQLVAQSEFGTLYMGANGNLIFKERNSPTISPDLAFTDDPDAVSAASKIPFSYVNVVYGSENLYNRILLSNGVDVATADDITSQGIYGVRTFSNDGLLTASATDLQGLADFLLQSYKVPTYRFQSVSVDITKLTTEQQNAVFDLEIGDVVNMHFTPTNVPPAIELPVRIIGIAQAWDVTSTVVTFSLETLTLGTFVLDSLDLGVLDQNKLGY